MVASEHKQALAGVMGHRALTVNCRNPDEAADTIAQLAARKPLDAVVAVDDEGVLVAALAGQRLGLAHNPPDAAARSRDKAAMRKALEDAGVPQPEFRMAGPDAEVGGLAAEVGLPCVVKPVSLSGSRGVIRVDDREAAVVAAKRVREILADADEDPDSPLLVERSIPGDEVAVEGLLRGGTLEPLAVFDKPDPLEGPYFEETIYVTPSITGDNPITAAFIANESGVDDFLAEATPENKMALIKEEQGKGRMVAMTGDGTNDAPALAQADVGVAMNTGTQAAKEAGNMVDLDSDPTKLIEIVEVGKQLLITRGALTTFSIANDVAKYFAILPAMFAFTYASSPGSHGPLWTINIMKLGTPLSAVTSAIIFNALVIPILIPLSLRGVRYRAIGATALLRRNLLIYGLGGIIAPFVGIKLIDLVIHNVLGA